MGAGRARDVPDGTHRNLSSRRALESSAGQPLGRQPELSDWVPQPELSDRVPRVPRSPGPRAPPLG